MNCHNLFVTEKYYQNTIIIFKHYFSIITSFITLLWQISRGKLKKFNNIQSSITPSLYTTFSTNISSTVSKSMEKRFMYLEKIINTPLLVFTYYELVLIY